MEASLEQLDEGKGANIQTKKHGDCWFLYFAAFTGNLNIILILSYPL